ncbi:hypothetical protein KI387_044326, partial [Taxus chinensis]
MRTNILEPNGTKGCTGRGLPKEPKVNQCMPRVIGQMRDKEAHFGANRKFMSQTVWDIWDKKTRRAQRSRQTRRPINARHVSQGKRSK